MATASTVSQFYRIVVRGHLDPSWTDWFDGLSITQEPTGYTVIAGAVADQAALYRLLIKLRDLGLPLLAVTLVKSNEGEKPCF